MEDFQDGSTQFQFTRHISLRVSRGICVFVQRSVKPFGQVGKQLFAQLLVKCVREQTRQRRQVVNNSQC